MIMIWKTKKLVKEIAFYGVCLVIAFCCLFPFYWAIVSSLRDSASLFSTELWPSKITFTNYIEVFNDVTFGHSFFNSAVVSVLTSLLTLAV